MVRTLSPRLLRLYRQTRYCGVGGVAFVDRRCPALDALLAAHRSREVVFVTAWNPYSRRMPQGWNCRMQQRLRQKLRRRKVFEASGALGHWQEDHLLVLAAPCWVIPLARRFRQNAVVSVRRGAPARLLLVK